MIQMLVNHKKTMWLAAECCNKKALTAPNPPPPRASPLAHSDF
jgi:hypothetical protein